jgi:hypothetical protein
MHWAKSSHSMVLKTTWQAIAQLVRLSIGKMARQTNRLQCNNAIAAGDLRDSSSCSLKAVWVIEY